MEADICPEAPTRQHRLRINPSCRELIRDLEQVAWKTDAHGNHVPELDKSDRRRTHLKVLSSVGRRHALVYDGPASAYNRRKIGTEQASRLGLARTRVS